MPREDVAEATYIGCPPIFNPSKPDAVVIYPDSATIALERLQRLTDLGKPDVGNLNSIDPERVLECISTHEWCLNNPNSFGYENIPPTDNFVDLLARIYLTSGKMKDKFMPTQARLQEYQDQLANPDRNRRDAGWRHYTKTTFDYYPQPTKHKHSRKLVHGLYKKLSPADEEVCKDAHESGVAVPAAYALNWEKFSDMSAYEKVVFSQVPMTPFEDSYNIILDAHVKANHKEGEDPHYGRDATYRRVTSRSCSITKDIVFKFVQNCPGCSRRTERCVRSRAIGIQTQRQNEAEGGNRRKNADHNEARAQPVATEHESQPDGDVGMMGVAGWIEDSQLYGNYANPGPGFQIGTLGQTTSSQQANMQQIDHTMYPINSEFHHFQPLPSLQTVNMQYFNHNPEPVTSQDHHYVQQMSSTQVVNGQPFSHSLNQSSDLGYRNIGETESSQPINRRMNYDGQAYEHTPNPRHFFLSLDIEETNILQFVSESNQILGDGSNVLGSLINDNQGQYNNNQFNGLDQTLSTQASSEEDWKEEYWAGHLSPVREFISLTNNPNNSGQEFLQERQYMVDLGMDNDLFSAAYAVGNPDLFEGPNPSELSGLA